MLKFNKEDIFIRVISFTISFIIFISFFAIFCGFLFDCSILQFFKNIITGVFNFFYENLMIGFGLK